MCAQVCECVWVKRECVCVSVVLWADSEGRLYWRRNLEHWLPEERLEKTSDQMENIHCAAPLHCPATGQGWALAVNNTHLTLSLSLSLFLPLAPFPHVPCGVVQLTPPSLVWNRRPYSLLGLAPSKKEAQFRLHSTSRPVQVSSQPGFGYMCSFYWCTFTVCCI